MGFVKENLSEQSCKDEKMNQKQSEDYGYTSGMCMSRKNTTNNISVAEPQIRKNTFSSKKIGTHFKTLTKFRRDADLKWLLSSNSKLWEDPEHPNQGHQFAS